MLRASALLAALALATAAPSLAEVITVSPDGAPSAEARPDPVVRGRVLAPAADPWAGFTAATLPPPDRAGLDTRPGIRMPNRSPDAGATGARVYFDPASDSAAAEARAAITVVRGTGIARGTAAQDTLGLRRISLAAGVEQLLADRCSLDPRYRHAVLAPAGAGSNLPTDF